MMLDFSNHDLEIVYAVCYQQWKLATVENLLDASHDLHMAMQNLKRAGYSPEAILLIERHAQTLIDRTSRPIRFVDVGSEEDTQPISPVEVD